MIWRVVIAFVLLVWFGRGFAERGADLDLPDLIDQSRASVLPVGTYAETDNPRFGFRGTGFVVGDGLSVITAAHVLPPQGDTSRGLVVQVPLGPPGRFESRQARPIASDLARDLVVLRIDGPALKPLSLANLAPREGRAVALLGFPLAGALGFSLVTHRGIVASITEMTLPAPTSATLSARVIRRMRDDPGIQVLQLDATVYPGNSGGPVLDGRSGEVIGVVSMTLVKATREAVIGNPSGITYAIPVQSVQDLLAKARSATHPR